MSSGRHRRLAGIADIVCDRWNSEGGRELQAVVRPLAKTTPRDSILGSGCVLRLLTHQSEKMPNFQNGTENISSWTEVGGALGLLYSCFTVIGQCVC